MRDECEYGSAAGVKASITLDYLCIAAKASKAPGYECGRKSIAGDDGGFCGGDMNTMAPHLYQSQKVCKVGGQPGMDGDYAYEGTGNSARLRAMHRRDRAVGSSVTESVTRSTGGHIVLLG